MSPSKWLRKGFVGLELVVLVGLVVGLVVGNKLVKTPQRVDSSAHGCGAPGPRCDNGKAAWCYEDRYEVNQSRCCSNTNTAEWRDCAAPAATAAPAAPAGDTCDKKNQLVCNDGHADWCNANGIWERGTKPCGTNKCFPGSSTASSCQDSNNYKDVGSSCTGFAGTCQKTTEYNGFSLCGCVADVAATPTTAAPTSASTCAPNASRCTGNTVERCLNGTTWTAYTQCGNGSSCSQITTNSANCVGNTPTPTQAALNVNIKANNQDNLSLVYGGSATLSWTSAGATACQASNAWGGNRNTSGSTNTGALTSTKTYSITCNNGSRSISDSVVVNVEAAPECTGNKQRCTAGTTLQRCEGNRWVMQQACVNGCRVSGSDTAECIPNPTATPTPFCVANAMRCNPSSGANAVQRCLSGNAWGNIANCPAGTTCTALSSTVANCVTNSALPTPTTPVLLRVDLKVHGKDNDTILQGEPVTLTWISDANSCEATGSTGDGWSGNKGPSGTLYTSNIYSNRRFEITCYGNGGSSVTDSVEVAVTAASSPATPAAGNQNLPVYCQLVPWLCGSGKQTGPRPTPTTSAGKSAPTKAVSPAPTIANSPIPTAIAKPAPTTVPVSGQTGGFQNQARSTVNGIINSIRKLFSF